MLYAIIAQILTVRTVKTAPVTFFAQSILGISFGYVEMNLPLRLNFYVDHDYSYATPRMLLALNIKACFIYGALSVPCCILMWLYVPETKGYVSSSLIRSETKRKDY